jgi:hypothetical protein
LKTIALTDHQTFDGIPEALDFGELFGIRVIPAVELYTGIRRDDGRVHQRRDVLVYFPDTAQFRRRQAAGWDEETWQLFNDGWNRRLDGSQWGDVPIRRVTEWARARGGVPVLAHPGLLSAERFHHEGWAYSAFERLFRETGLAGIEISHSKLPFNENTQRYAPLVRQYNQTHPEDPILFTMGTDSHAPDGIGRANLTEQTVRFVAQELVDGGPDSLHSAILRALQEAAGRIGRQAGLYTKRDEVLNGIYPVDSPRDRPLSVTRIDSEAASDTICAGIKMIDGRPMIIAINRGRQEHHEGKAWGAIDVSDSVLSELDRTPELQLREAITGEEYIRSVADLARNGLRVGLPPMGTQFLIVEGP